MHLKYMNLQIKLHLPEQITAKSGLTIVTKIKYIRKI